MIFAGVPFATTPFADGPAVSGTAAVVGDGAVTLNLDVSGAGSYQADPVVGYAEIAPLVSGVGYTTVYADGSLSIDLSSIGVAAHGVNGIDGAGIVGLDVYGRCLAVFASGNIVIQPKVVGISLATVRADSTDPIQYELDVSGAGSVTIIVSGTGQAIIGMAVTGAGAHGVSGAGDVSVSPVGSGLGYRGAASVFGEGAYALDVRGRSRHLPNLVPLISGVGDFMMQPIVSGAGVVGAKGSGDFSVPMEAFGNDLIPTGRGKAVANISIAGFCEHHSPITVSGRVVISPIITGDGSFFDSIGYVIGGNRNPIHLTIAGSGYHA